MNLKSIIAKIERKPDLVKEKKRQKSQREKILELLVSGNATTLTLNKIAYNYTMRISELRKDGHVIIAMYEKPGVYNYTYLGQRD